jgi:hypothetical protein
MWKQINNKNGLKKSHTIRMRPDSPDDDDDDDDQKMAGISSIMIMDKDDASPSNYVQADSQDKITIKFKSSNNYRTRKGSEDIMLNMTGSNPALKDSSTHLEDNKYGFAFGQSKQSNDVAQYKSWKDAKKSSHSLSFNDPEQPAGFNVFHRPKTVTHKDSNFSEYDDIIVHELSKEGSTARNSVYNFTVNKNEHKFKSCSQKSFNNP